MSNLVIVESPAKAKTIKKYLGSDYEVVASMGHVRDLPKARLSVDIKNGFAPKYDIIKGKVYFRAARGLLQACGIQRDHKDRRSERNEQSERD